MSGQQQSTQEKLFRKVSLDKLSSPEQLDMMVKITSPKGWISLLTLIMLIVFALIWSIVGSIPTKVNGSVVLVKTGGVYTVSVPSSGLVTDVSVVSGEFIRQGQKVARISQPGLLEKFNDLKARKYELLDKATQSTKLINEKKEILNKNIIALTAKVKAQKKLHEKLLITNQTIIDTQQRLDESRNQLKQLEIQSLETEQQLHQLDRNIESVKAELKLNTNVVSPYSGRVLEITFDQGKIVGAGTPLLNMELVGNSIKNLEAVVYLSPFDGKKVKPGMTVYIAPSTVKREEFGYMLGKVTAVAEFPSTNQGMMRILQNEKLVTQLSQGAAPIQVNVDLIPNQNTVSGYSWTSPGGAPVTIQSGTLGSATITVREQRPITLVIPLLKEFLGL